PAPGPRTPGLAPPAVVAALPLLALGLVAAAAGLDDAELVEPERVANDLQQRLALLVDLELPAVVDRMGAIAADLVDDLAEDRDDIAVAEGEDGVEMHRRPALRHQAGDDARRGLVLEQR